MKLRKKTKEHTVQKVIRPTSSLLEKIEKRGRKEGLNFQQTILALAEWALEHEKDKVG